MSLTLLLALIACRPPEDDPTPEPSPILDVDASQEWTLEGLDATGHVVFTEMNVPHIYAASEEDLYRIQGFIVARDRFFMLELVRRLSQGTLTELLGDVVLETDMESRGIGMAHVTDNILAVADGDPEFAALLDAYATGINAYIDAVAEGELPHPSELDFAAGLLGFDSPVDAMEHWDRRDVAAIGGTIMFRLGYETDDPSTDRDWRASEDRFSGADLEDLRQAGLWEDIWGRPGPVHEVSPASGWGPYGSTRRSTPDADAGRRPAVAPGLVDRLDRHLLRIEDRLGRPRDTDFGSNAWAVSAEASADGRAILAGDGHLELDIPSLLYQVGQDTAELGDGEITTTGLLIVGLPFLAQGTNGRVAWATTQLSGDVTDWYADELELDADGRPARSLTSAGWQDLTVVDETYVVRDVPVLDSVGRMETWQRYITADGRWITAIEGRDVSPDESVEAGEAIVTLLGDFVVPEDTDGDGVISAISFDYTGLDGGTLFQLFDSLLRADDVGEFHEGVTKALAISQNFMAADIHGDVYYSGYQMVPCRGYLGPVGEWPEGADPRRLIDASTYGGFTIPIQDNGSVDESQSADPQRCVVPHDETPHSFTPNSGFLVSANNDIAGITFDDNLLNEPHYIGGPWDVGYRAWAISNELEVAIDDGGATLDDMDAIQSYRKSVLGMQFQPFLIEVMDRVRDQAASGTTTDAEARAVQIWLDNEGRFDEAYDRLTAWRDRGYHTHSGVDTFYHQLGENEVEDAIATMIHNTWMGDLKRASIDDEGLPGRAFQRSGGDLRLLSLLVDGRGASNPEDLGSWNPDTEESAFWDHRSTPGVVEESDEIALIALENALDFLSSAPTDDDAGGFGTDDMDQWIWGLRQQVKFESLLGAYIDDPLFKSLLTPFSITTDNLPLQSSTPGADDLTWFPRGGDKRGPDASSNSMSGRSFQYGSGPVDRIAFALEEGNIDGYMIIPGGQSGLSESPHFDDQAALWLANDAIPVRFTVDEVVEGAEERWVFSP